MKYFKDTNNNPFEFEDNVTKDVITHVEGVHDTTLTEITEDDYKIMITPTKEEVAKQEQEKINAEALAYLSSTDWYVIRQSEGGKVMPDDIKKFRDDARLKVVGV